MNQRAVLKRVRTSVLDIAYEESGPTDGIAVLLMHGFPYDPRTYDEGVPPLVETGCRVKPICAALVRPASSRPRRCARAG